MPERTDSASRIINATPEKIYQALLNADAIVQWRPPAGMTARVFLFEGKQGGKYKMSFVYEDQGKASAGKTTADADVFEGVFEELLENRKVVERVKFESPDPAFAGKMKVTTTLSPVQNRTEVTMMAEDVPAGISHEDHVKGIRSSLEQLAAFVEPEVAK